MDVVSIRIITTYLLIIINFILPVTLCDHDMFALFVCPSSSSHCSYWNLGKKHKILCWKGMFAFEGSVILFYRLLAELELI